MRVAAIQMRSNTSIADNCVVLETMVRNAAREGAFYIQTPEMTGILQKNPKGLFSEIKEQSEDILVELSSQLAKELGPGKNLVINMSGRGDKDMPQVARIMGVEV